MFWVEFCSFSNQNMHMCVMLPKIHTLLKSSFFLFYELLMWCDSKGCSCGRPIFEVICNIYCLTQDFLEFGHQTLWS